MAKWLGTVGLYGKTFLPYKEAEAFVRNLRMSSIKGWNLYRNRRKGHPVHGKRPLNIPSNPNVTYANSGWVDWGTWLGTFFVAHQKRKHRDFGEAKQFVHQLGLKSLREWGEYAKGEMPHLPPKPEDIPYAARSVYLNKGWKGGGDWLGTGTTQPQKREYRPFTEARIFVRKLGLKSFAEWATYKAGHRADLPPQPDDIPATPHAIYRNKGWLSWPDFLGTAPGKKPRKMKRKK